MPKQTPGSLNTLQPVMEKDTPAKENKQQTTNTTNEINILSNDSVRT